MIKHSFKLIWNQKKKNAYIIVELFIMFFILFITGSFVYEKAVRYYEGVGADISNKYYIYLFKNNKVEDNYNKYEVFQKVKQSLLDLDNVKRVSITQNGAPYTGSISKYDIQNGNKSANIAERQTDADFANLFKPNIIKGRWFTEEEMNNTIIPVLIDSETEEYLFDGKGGINKILTGGRSTDEVETKYKVIGIIDFMKYGDYSVKLSTMIIPCTRSYWNISQRSEVVLELDDLSKQNPMEYAEAIFSVLDPNDWTIHRSTTFAPMKRGVNSYSASDLRTTIIISMFFLINIVLGMFGILGYNINRRRAEIGLRRAIGATKKQIRKLLFAEMIMITLISIIPAIVIILNMQIFIHGSKHLDVTIPSLIGSVIFIFVIVSLCVYYPAILASRIEPATALQDE